VSCAHSNTSYDDIFFDLLYFLLTIFFFLQIYVLYICAIFMVQNNFKSLFYNMHR
jgi:hypothetical protein